MKVVTNRYLRFFSRLLPPYHADIQPSHSTESESEMTEEVGS